ncbi:ACP S-malonyltransferase [Chryseobacterium sp. B21-037]|uniref:ACP S-malonyltransferase n=1 Tax=unclassified Chryseobacterium TaxID=2593645 RepID=UPI002359F968|nr:MULTISPECIES: ACP S-malonyltransferase [unclassified Chryseobacterium]MDC8103588.1 ACP S-malonyltransferase [Chryseobacterium sp. B21-037]MDQ1803193.1 ACP S-malonyltransferase [Chryseobacterium sp. CKR4-1]
MKAVMFPGQGSQYKGMGKDLFNQFRKETILASEILGYDLEELCIKDPERQLGKTQFTQPALYTVNAFTHYVNSSGSKPDFFIGHSLGEYNALLAAEAFSFETGLKLVQKRGALMAAASGGGMAAVLGLKVDAVQKLLAEGGYSDIDIANINTPTQIVIAGPQDSIDRIVQEFEERKIKIFPLFVSAPFHSRYMKPAATEFKDYLQNFSFSALKTPVIANVTAKPYPDGQIIELLAQQIESSVQWTDTIRTLMGKGVTEYEETGSVILTKMVNEITENCTPLIHEEEIVIETAKPHVNGSVNGKVNGEASKKECLSTRLGSHEFRKDYGLKYAYVAGSMYRGIASPQLVVRLGKNGFMGFLGTGGMPLTEIEKNIIKIQEELTHGEPYGVNFLHNLNDPASEMKAIELLLLYGVTNIEASAYMQMMPALVYYRLKGLQKGPNGEVICKHNIIAKVSRPEVAEVFMRPAPEKIVRHLLEEELITPEQAALSKKVPMSYDICVEADSGGHTDRGIAMVLLPSIQRLRADIMAEYAYDKGIRVGLAGGIGTPQAATCAYIMGADFIVTGSVNQCTVEAGTSDAVKDLLQDINVQDTDYAPAGDMFEIGAKVQVLRRGVLFAARANKLYALYNQYNSLDEIPEKTLTQLEKTYFEKNISEIWNEVREYCRNVGAEAEITKAEQNPKNKMALVFRWYFGYTNRLAFEGNIENKANFQIHTGSALGAFNQWVKGTPMESWKKRHVDEIGVNIMVGAAKLLENTALMVNN